MIRCLVQWCEPFQVAQVRIDAGISKEKFDTAVHAVLSRDVQRCGSIRGVGCIRIDARVGEENLNAAVHAFGCSGVQWRLSASLRQVGVDTGIGQEELDVAAPSIIALDK